MVSRNRLKLVMLCWALLVMATIWVDWSAVSLVFGGFTCALGVVILIVNSSSVGRERKESRGVGLLLIITGTFFTVVQAYDVFAIGYH